MDDGQLDGVLYSDDDNRQLDTRIGLGATVAIPLEKPVPVTDGNVEQQFHQVNAFKVISMVERGGNGTTSIRSWSLMTGVRGFVLNARSCWVKIRFLICRSKREWISAIIEGWGWKNPTFTNSL